MSATEMERHDAQPGGAPRPALWLNHARLNTLARRHALPAGAAIVTGAILRLVWLGDTSFLGDQAQLLALGRSAFDHHALIITGIPSSIGTFNPPVSTWVYGIFAVVGGPLGATLFTALANIVAIALLYAIATRYLGRSAGFAAALLYATASGPVRYSRFIWQQNLLAPTLLLFFWVILLAVVERRRGWLGWSVLLWGAAAQLHPTAAPLLALTGVAALFTWRELRWRDIAWAAAAFVGLFGPTVLWEIVSHGADLQGAQRFSQGHAVFDTWALTYLVQLMQPAPADWFGAGTAYTAMGRALVPLGSLVEGLLIAAQVWLVGVIAWPWLRRDATQPHAIRPWMTDSRWLFALCLALWEALPLVFMLRHSRPVEPHYLLVLLPGAYLAVGASLAWASFWIQRILPQPPYSQPLWRTPGAIALAAILLVISAAQIAGVSSELATIHGGAFNGLELPLHYGTPLSSERDALAATQAAARRLHAPIAIASTRVQQEPLGYLNATSGGAAATDYISDGCVALPAANAAAPLVTLAVPSGAAAQLLPSVPGARLLKEVPVKGGQPYLLYDIAPGATVTGEQPIAESIGAPASQPHPVAVVYTTTASAGRALTLRWVGSPTLRSDAANALSYWYGSDPHGSPIADYTFTFQALDAQGQPLGAPLTTICSRLGWSSQLSVVTTTPLPARLLTGAQVATWRVSAQMAPAVATRPTLGPLSLETGDITFGPSQSLGAPVTIAVPLR